MAGEKEFLVRVMTPERMLFEGDADFLEMTASEGEIGVYRGHAPTSCILMPGALRIYRGEEEKTAAVHGGFAEILQEEVRILAETAEWPEEIDVGRARKAKARAEKRLEEKKPETDLLRAEAALRRALIRLEVAEK